MNESSSPDLCSDRSNFYGEAKEGCLRPLLSTYFEDIDFWLKPGYFLSPRGGHASLAWGEVCRLPRPTL